MSTRHLLPSPIYSFSLQICNYLSLSFRSMSRLDSLPSHNSLFLPLPTSVPRVASQEHEQFVTEVVHNFDSSNEREREFSLKIEMTVKGETSQACAACKHQRRKCAEDCPLAPYFPAEQPRQFQNAHKLFGVSNIVKILNKLEAPEQKAEAMRSILYEANIRFRYPVHGCLGVIAALQLQIQQAQLELETINAQLAIHRSHYPPSKIPSPTLQLSSSSSSSPHEAAAANFLPFDTISTGILLAESSHNSSIQNDVNMLHLSWDQNYSDAGVGNLRGVAAQEVETHPFGMEMVSGVQLPKTEYDEISPFFDTIDEERQSYIDSKEAYESM